MLSSHPRLIRLVILAVAPVTGCGVARASPSKCVPAAVLTEADIRADLLELGFLVQRDWSYAEARLRDGVTPDRLVLEAYSALKETGRNGFAQALERFVASMHDGHAQVVEPPPHPERKWPIQIAEAREGVVVTRAAEGVARGDLVLAVDGIGVDALIKRALLRTSGSTPTGRRYWAVQRIAETNELTVRATIRGVNGVRRVVYLATVPCSEMVPRQAAIDWRLFPGGVGYLRIASLGLPDWSRWIGDITASERAQMIAPVVERIRRAFNELARTPALVIDLRGNTGGTDFIGREVAAHLLPSGVTYYQLSQRDTRGIWSTFQKDYLTASTPSYSHPVAVIIDEATFSAADNLAACLHDLHPHVVFVGRPTGGGTGAPRIVTLPRSCAQVSFSTIRVLSPHGRQIEGSGTLPDVPVRWTQDDYRQGRDPDFAAALTALGEPSPELLR